MWSSSTQSLVVAIPKPPIPRACISCFIQKNCRSVASICLPYAPYACQLHLFVMCSIRIFAFSSRILLFPYNLHNSFLPLNTQHRHRVYSLAAAVFFLLHTVWFIVIRNPVAICSANLSPRSNFRSSSKSQLRPRGTSIKSYKNHCPPGSMIPHFKN